MEKKIRIGYLSSIAIAPLLVAIEKSWFESAGIDVEAIQQMGWRSITRQLDAGTLQGAIVPTTLPFAAAQEKQDKKINYKACVAMGFGGSSLVGYTRFLQDFNTTRKPTQLRFGTNGTLSPDLHHVRRWLQKSQLVDLEEGLTTVEIGSTQKSEFLVENLIDLYLSIEPWITIAQKRGIAARITCNEPFETSYPNRTLVLSNDWLTLNPNAHTNIIEIFDRAAEWIENKENSVELLQILKKTSWPIEDEELLNLFQGSDRKYSFRRHERESLSLCQEDLFAAWETFCLGQEKATPEAAFSVPKWATETFTLSPQMKLTSR